MGTQRWGLTVQLCYWFPAEAWIRITRKLIKTDCGPHTRSSDSVGLDEIPEFAFLTSSQVMLLPLPLLMLVQRLHVRDNTLITTRLPNRQDKQCLKAIQSKKPHFTQQFQSSLPKQFRLSFFWLSSQKVTHSKPCIPEKCLVVVYGQPNCYTNNVFSLNPPTCPCISSVYFFNNSNYICCI